MPCILLMMVQVLRTCLQTLLTDGLQMCIRDRFSDDAYYQCPYTGRLFFGGIDGLLYLDKEVATAPEFYPNILLRKLMIGRKEVNLGDYYTDGEIGRAHV